MNRNQSNSGKSYLHTLFDTFVFDVQTFCMVFLNWMNHNHSKPYTLYPYISYHGNTDIQTSRDREKSVEVPPIEKTSSYHETYDNTPMFKTLENLQGTVDGLVHEQKLQKETLKSLTDHLEKQPEERNVSSNELSTIIVQQNSYFNRLFLDVIKTLLDRDRNGGIESYSGQSVFERFVTEQKSQKEFYTHLTDQLQSQQEESLYLIGSSLDQMQQRQNAILNQMMEILSRSDHDRASYTAHINHLYTTLNHLQTKVERPIMHDQNVGTDSVMDVYGGTAEAAARPLADSLQQIQTQQEHILMCLEDIVNRMTVTVESDLRFSRVRGSEMVDIGTQTRGARRTIDKRHSSGSTSVESIESNEEHRQHVKKPANVKDIDNGRMNLFGGTNTDFDKLRKEREDQGDPRVPRISRSRLSR